jgi:uncharacterized membrane protein YbjE (DUF340 family)
MLGVASTDLGYTDPTQVTWTRRSVMGAAAVCCVAGTCGGDRCAAAAGTVCREALSSAPAGGWGSLSTVTLGGPSPETNVMRGILIFQKSDWKSLGLVYQHVWEGRNEACRNK